MGETLQLMSGRGIVQLVILVILAGIVIYGILRWSRRSNAMEPVVPIPPPEFGRATAHDQARACSSESPSVRRTDLAAEANPRVLGRLRAGREGDRLSEDDVARKQLPARPGPPPADTLPENLTQIPKPLDPGHTA
jgi:hypothetical protein